MSEKIRDLWEQRKLLLKANYLDVKLNFLCERKPVNENSCGMDAHLILFGTRLHTNKPILIAWISIVFILGRNRFYYSKTDYLGMKSRTGFHWTLTLLKGKIFSAELAGVFTRKKFTVIILRKKCLSYKIRWLISPISCCTSLAFCDTLLGWWMNGKFSFLNKVAFQVVCKCLWCLYNKQNNTWLLVDMGLLFS